MVSSTIDQRDSLEEISATPKVVAVQVNNLTLKNEDGLQIIENISFSVDEGEMVFIIGPTGSGKTTLLNLLGRQIIASNENKPSIFFYGQPLSMDNLRHVCYLKQDVSMAFKGVLRKELEFYASMSPIHGLNAYDRVNDVAHDLEIEHILDRKMDIEDTRISSGELKRVQLCTALLRFLFRRGIYSLIR